MFDIRGLMLDSARLTEQRSVYRDYITFAAQWNYNALFWHFTDDQGCSLVFPRRPELASPHAYTQKEMRALIAFAARHGLDVIPEIECFGHASFITNHPRYQHLKDGVPGKLFGALCVFEPAARAILRDLLRDAAETFPSKYLHVGMDETAFGAHPTSAQLLKNKPKYELYAEHVKWLHSEVTTLGKTMMMWADHLYPISKAELAKATYLDADSINSKIAEMLPRDIIMCVWQYSPKPKRAYVEHLQRLGFQVLVCPATSAWGLMVHPRTWNLDNLRDSAQLAKSTKALGMVNTVWCPQRYFPGTTLFGIAYSAVCRDSRNAAPPYAKFVRETFGIAKPVRVVSALKVLHAVMVHKNILAHVLPIANENLENVKPAEWRALNMMSDAAQRAFERLRVMRPCVQRNLVYYDDILFAAHCMSELGTHVVFIRLVLKIRNATRAVTAQETVEKAHGLTRAMLVLLQRKVGGLLREARQRWNATRFADDPKRTHGSSSADTDALLARLIGTEKFYTNMCKELSADMRRSAGRS